MTELVELLRSAAGLRAKRAALKQEQTDIKNEEDELLRKARDIIDNSGLESVKFTNTDGKSMIAYRQTTHRASMSDPDLFKAWCEKEGLDPADFTMSSTQKLTSFVRERIENETGLPVGLKVAEFDEVRIRKS